MRKMLSFDLSESLHVETLYANGDPEVLACLHNKYLYTDDMIVKLTKQHDTNIVSIKY